MTHDNARPQPILRFREPALANVEQAREAGRLWFDEHPDEDSYIREFAGREFSAKELPPIPPGCRYETMVSRVRDAAGATIGRHRQLMAILELDALFKADSKPPSR